MFINETLPLSDGPRLDADIRLRLPETSKSNCTRPGACVLSPAEMPSVAITISLTLDSGVEASP
jgi:hypothetical protein